MSVVPLNDSKKSLNGEDEETKLSASSSDSHSKLATCSGKKGGSAHIIDKIKNSIKEGKKTFSVEFFPPRTAAGVDNLYARIDRFSNLEPVFMDITWGAGGRTGDLTLEMSATVQNFSSAEVMMHLTCTNMPLEKILGALQYAYEHGVRNILALRGDPPIGQERWVAVEGGLHHAIDLVKLIRKLYGDWFGIAVAGYPEKHSEAQSIEEDIKNLKEKVEAGADFIITQLFYDVDNFFEWTQKCRDAGITCPIIPGIMPIQNYAGFKRMTSFCNTFIPNDITSQLEPIKDNDAAVREFGIKYCTKMCERLLEDQHVPGIHFYTVNLEKSVVGILENLGWISPCPEDKRNRMPWKPSQAKRRQNETVRPIFWSNRSDVYLQRTTTWDEFPNGRWGCSSSPAFGELADYHLCPFTAGTIEERVAIWGASLSSEADVYNIFSDYINGKVSRLPWCESSLKLETNILSHRLSALNKRGFLTINSQPRVNAASSTDPAVGWGEPGGFVYQKAYLEFFIPPSRLQDFVKQVKQHPQLAFTASNVNGDRLSTHENHTVTAVTWGVFPNQEIIQPTIVDTEIFTTWKDEAFALWLSQWQSIYPVGSESWKIIQNIHDTYYLICLVDNDFINGDIFAPFFNLL